MQPIAAAAHRVRAYLESRSSEQKHVLIGVVSVGTAVIVAVAAGALYLHPLRQQRVVFETTDAAALRTGEEVRVAGVPAGKVTEVRLRPDHVEIELTVDDSVFLGAETAVDVRMLTAAGGYYVALVSAGEAALGNRTIPAARVHLPYRLPELLDDAPPKIAALDAPAIGTDLDQAAAALEANPGSVKSMIDSVQALAGVLDRQRDQVGTSLTVTQEYLGAFGNRRDVLFNMLRKAAIVLRVLDDTHVEFAYAYQGLAQVFTSVKTLTTFYANHRDEVYDAVRQLDAAAHSVNTDLPTLIGQLQTFVDYLQSLLGPDGIRLAGGDQVLATDLCIPIPGRSC
ncbi:MlaD family protein [Nocardia sp. NBC_01503]|uniref:MlaD family protein n=1 Tax=Nocardia sp. NBC_01503 TaxID=2975997 RepID=UPI002E7B7069|nr:MlaD family protein [Nocardia sp. NBC_01503]WTL32144.1 MlaD family protein [Nocardia sp. NBC_01503]